MKYGHRTHLLIIALFLFATLPIVSNAQPLVTKASVQTQPKELGDDSSFVEWEVGRCLAGISYGSPLKFSAALAVGVRRSSEHRTICTHIATRLGTGGFRTSVGSAVTFGTSGSAIGASAGLIRTFGNPAGEANPWSNWFGGSIHVWPLLGIHTELGLYSRLNTPNSDKRQTITVWSAGFGY